MSCCAVAAGKQRAFQVEYGRQRYPGKIFFAGGDESFA